VGVAWDVLLACLRSCTSCALALVVVHQENGKTVADSEATPKDGVVSRDCPRQSTDMR
jgi:hypothetical protein